MSIFEDTNTNHHSAKALQDPLTLVVKGKSKVALSEKSMTITTASKEESPQHDDKGIAYRTLEYLENLRDDTHSFALPDDVEAFLDEACTSSPRLAETARVGDEYLEAFLRRKVSNTATERK